MSKSLLSWYHSPGTSTPAGAQNGLSLDPGQFGVEKAHGFFFVETGNDWATEAAPLAEGHVTVLGAAVTVCVDTAYQVSLPK